MWWVLFVVFCLVVFLLMLKTIGDFNKVLTISQWDYAKSILLACSFDRTKLEYLLQLNKVQNI